MKPRVNFRFPTYLDAMHDCDRVLDLIRQSVIGKTLIPSVTVYERGADMGGGFGWFFTCGPISVSCRSLLRYTASYATPTRSGHHSEDFEAPTAEEAIQALRDHLEERMERQRLALAVLAGPQ